MCTIAMAFTGQYKKEHIITRMVSLDVLYFAGMNAVLVRDKLVNFRDILILIRDMAGNSYSTWLSSNSFYLL